MTVPNTTKQYWIEQIESTIDKQIDDIKTEIDWNDDTQLEKAKTDVLVNMNLSDILEDVRRLEKELEVADRVKDEKDNALADARAKLSEALGLRYHSFYSDPLQSRELEKMAKALVEERLSQNGVYEEIKRLRTLKTASERSIMLATSPTNLREFMEKFMTNNGVNFIEV